MGVDPGTNTGIAIIDLEGNLVHLSSRRNTGPEKIIRIITRHGTPLIVATDVSPAPSNVEKIASSMGSVLFVPEESMNVSEKHKLVKKFQALLKKSEPGIEIKGKHEKDALAAAIKAWKSNRFLFRKVKSALDRTGLNSIFDKVVSRILKGKNENITTAIRNTIKKRRRKNDDKTK